ncbi:MAG: hypothetical protein PXY39_12845 [archaeon]|nr:hypothetical protein [archaeon]
MKTESSLPRTKGQHWEEGQKPGDAIIGGIIALILGAALAATSLWAIGIVMLAIGIFVLIGTVLNLFRR